MDGEHTRPRVFRSAPSRFGGGSAEGNSDVRVRVRQSPARAPETAREGACAPPLNVTHPSQRSAHFKTHFKTDLNHQEIFELMGNRSVMHCEGGNRESLIGERLPGNQLLHLRLFRRSP